MAGKPITQGTAATQFDPELWHVLEAAIRANADYDAAALKARTAWDDHTAAWLEADRLRLIRNDAVKSLAVAMVERKVNSIKFDGKLWTVVDGLLTQTFPGSRVRAVRVPK